MVNVLSPTFTDVESQKAVYDRFFFDPYRQAIELLWRHEELLNHDVGVLVQAHIEPDGSFAEIDEMADKPTVSLLLDARQRDQQHLVMQLETAQPYGPRAIRQLITSPQKVEAWEFSIDAQGGVRSTKSTHPHQVIHEMLTLLDSPYAMRLMMEKRQRRQQAEIALGNFAIANTTKLGKEKYEKSLKNHQLQIDNAGFQHLLPFEQPETESQQLAWIVAKIPKGSRLADGTITPGDRLSLR